MSPVLYEQRRVARSSGPSERLPFLVRFWANKNEHKNVFNMIVTNYMVISRKLSLNHLHSIAWIDQLS
jgi:hypothetical protein